MAEKKSMLSSISYVMIIMLLSRVLALVSSSMYVSFFGTEDVYINIYSYAITIPNTIFNVKNVLDGVDWNKHND